jgi:hypothetical protein
MPESIGPAIARDRLRARLRELRESRGRIPADVASGLAWPDGAVEQVESGARVLTPLEAEQLLAAYPADAPEIPLLLSYARIAWSGRWWATHRLSGEYQLFVGHEAEATRIVAYMTSLVPPLQQTRRYALAATGTILGRPESDPDVVARAQVRAERQRSVADRLAAGHPIEVVAIVDDAVLRRPLGGVEVMGEQLDRLAEEAEREHVTLVVMPTARAHAGLDGKFEFVELDDGEPAVFLEGPARDYLERDPRVTGRYREIADDLVARGIGGAEAVELVRRVRGEIGS